MERTSARWERKLRAPRHPVLRRQRDCGRREPVGRSRGANTWRTHAGPCSGPHLDCALRHARAHHTSRPRPARCAIRRAPRTPKDLNPRDFRRRSTPLPPARSIFMASSSSVTVRLSRKSSVVVATRRSTARPLGSSLSTPVRCTTCVHQQVGDGAVLGNCSRQGKTPPLVTPVLDLYPALAHLRTDGREAITIENLLTMTTGLEWDEHAYGTLANDETGLFWRTSQARHTFDRPMKAAPGTTFNYNGGAPPSSRTCLRGTQAHRCRRSPRNIFLRHSTSSTGAGCMTIEIGRRRSQDCGCAPAILYASAA